MQPMIECGDILEMLKAKAEPLVDTPSSVLQQFLVFSQLRRATLSAAYATRAPPARRTDPSCPSRNMRSHPPYLRTRTRAEP